MSRELDTGIKEEVFSMVFDLVMQESGNGESREDVLQDCYQIIECLKEADEDAELDKDIDYMKNVLPLVVSKVTTD